MNPFSKRFFKFIPILIQSAWVNFRIFPFKTAIKIPLLIKCRNPKIPRGSIVISCKKIRPGMIRFGIDGSSHLTPNHTLINISVGGKLLVGDTTYFCEGCSIFIYPQAVMKVGNNVKINSNCTFKVASTLELQDETLFGWDIEVNDFDGHALWVNGIRQPNVKPIIIKSHSWIGANSLISKGAVVPKGTIVAQRSIVNKPYKIENSIIGGAPARVLKENCHWDWDNTMVFEDKVKCQS